MKKNKELLELNKKFKESLDENNKSRWESLCKYWTINSIMTLFIEWISKNNWYNISSNFISWWIINELKIEKHVQRLDKKYYLWIQYLFKEFLDFYKNNPNFKNEINKYIYESKKWLIQSENNENLNNWIKFIEENKFEKWDKHRDNLKHFLSFLKKSDIIFIFNQFQKQAEKLNILRKNNEKDPFHKVEWILDNEIRLKKINEDFIKRINSLFSIYLHSRKNIWDTLWEDIADASDIQEYIKEELKNNIEKECRQIEESWWYVVVDWEIYALANVPKDYK